MLIDGRRIKEVRQQNKYTQAELAKKARISRTYLSDVENGRYNPSIETLGDIARALEVDIKIFFDSEKDFIKSALSADGMNIISVPILGRIPAGVPIEAIENIEDYEEVIIPSYESEKEYFGLRVVGESMSPRILDGDVVICKKQEDVNSGDVAAVYINGYDVTLKQVRKDEPGLTLIPFNPSYPPKFYSWDEVGKMPVKIAGKVVELRGKF